MATVAELIKFLEDQPQDLVVAYRLHSEQCILDIEQIEVDELCEPRSDGWIQNNRPDLPQRTYLVFPGN